MTCWTGLLFAVAITACTTSHQSSFIEADAPERAVAGCYAVFLNQPDHEALTDALPDSQPAFFPDTIQLTLNADHYGFVIADAPWRSSGWRLLVRPDPSVAEHRFAHWRLDQRGHLAIQWPAWPRTKRSFRGVGQPTLRWSPNSSWV